MGYRSQRHWPESAHKCRYRSVREIRHYRAVESLFVRDQSTMKLRVRLGPNGRGSALPTWATVEWVGRAGHPSSYGLLTGARSRSPGLAIAEEGARYREALSGGADRVIWGLPEEYATVVAAALDDDAQPVLVSQAAHGEVGSSQYVFAGLTRLLCRLLAGGLPSDEEDVWRLRDKCWGER
jgi:hypothetical protein